MSHEPHPPLVSIVVPLFNEQDNVRPLLARIAKAMQRSDCRFEIVAVDDGSADETAHELRTASADLLVRLVQLARNFGHQAALVAGISAAGGDAVVTLDGDLQHPPELIPALIERWQSGVEVVQAVRRDPIDLSPIKRTGSRLFYRVLSSVSRIQVTSGAADFRLMSRSAANAFLECQERCRFNRGLVQWIGFDREEVYYDAEPRHAGKSKYSYRAMLRLAGDAVFSFSSWPLRAAGLAGGCVSLAAAAYLVFVIWARLFTDRVVPGWSSILAAVLVIGGVQLIVLWILGEYVGRLYEEAKRRPLYVVKDTPKADRASASDSEDDRARD